MTGTAAHKTILVCDDDEIYVEIIEKILSDNGFTVVTAGDIFTCLEKLTEARPHLLLDIDMPSGSGLQLLETIHKKPDVFRSHVFVISGYQDEGRIETARKLGAKKFFVKPISAKMLLEEVKKLLGPEAVADGAQ